MSANFSRIPAAAAALLLTFFLVPAAFGQAAQFQLLADVPFDFHISGKLLPAGTYRITPLGAHSVIVAAMEPAGPHAAALTNPSGGGAVHDRSELIFNRYGSQYFLRQVWRAGVDTGRDLPASRPEREVMFRAADTSERVYVAARDTR